MSKSKNLLVLLTILILLSGAYIYLKYRPLPVTESETKTISLLKLEDKKILKISLFSRKESWTLMKKGDKWVLREQPSFPLDNNKVSELTYSLSDLTAQEIIAEQSTDLEQFGLKKPLVVVKVLLNDNTIKEFSLGNRTPVGNAFYFILQGDPKVYSVPDYKGDKFIYTLTDLRDKSLVTINTQDFTYFKLSRKEGPVIEIKPVSNPTDGNQFGIGLWQMTKPYKEPQPVNGEQFQKILNTVANLTSVGEYIDEDAVNLNKYGLSPAQAELQIKDSKNSLHLIIGKDKDESNVYCRTPDSTVVFTLSKDTLSFIYMKPMELIDRLAYIVNINDVSKIIIQNKSESHTLLIDQKLVKTSKKEKEDRIVTTYWADSKKVTEQGFKKFYQSLIGLQIDTENHRIMAENNPEVQTVFYLRNNQIVKVNYVPYNRDFYAVFKNGISEFLIFRDSVGLMLDMLNQLIAGNHKTED